MIETGIMDEAQCGGFEIPYPTYKWYKNQDSMFKMIQSQNKAITAFIYNYKHKVLKCESNHEVLEILGLDSNVKIDEYNKKDVDVYVYSP